MTRPDAPPAPYQSCIVCFRGDTDTAVAFRGEAEWCIVALSRVGVPLDQAEATFMLFAEKGLGCDPGKVPGGEVEYVVRLCRECAARAGVRVGRVEEGAEIPVYGQEE